MPEQRSVRRLALHVTRVAMFVAVVMLVRLQHQRLTGSTADAGAQIRPHHVAEFLPGVHAVEPDSADTTTVRVLNQQEEDLGSAIQTSPQGDDFIGFSGATNVLLVFTGEPPRIAGVNILSTGDTREHVEQIREDEHFLKSWDGLTWPEAAKLTNLDAVSGATLTSLAIHESILARLGGGRPSLRFPEPVSLETARQLFPDAVALSPDAVLSSLWHVHGPTQEVMGTILRTSPGADYVIGYQGPTETLVAFDPDEQVVGLVVAESYDNDKYVGWVRDDRYFRNLFNGLLVEELGDPAGPLSQVEGVSGATMTSQAVADGILLAAQQHISNVQTARTPAETSFPLATRDIGSIVVTVFGILIAFTRLRGSKAVRLLFQGVLICYLGLMNGDMVSQALLAGWAKNGVAWKTAPGLVFLTFAAFLIPICSKRNVYCSHLCPHGAVQGLVKNRLPWRVHLSRRANRALKLIPGLLLLWSATVVIASLPFSLIGIEPFDAWVWSIAGPATITVAVVGLVASLFVPMAYCRYGCPTGMLLNALRFHGHSDRWTPRDSLALAATVLAAVSLLT